MAKYKYAFHDNNVFIREWCDASRGRGVALSEKLFPNVKFPKITIGKYKCGEQLIDDVMFERAKEIIKEIEHEEKTGKRKVGKRIKGAKLETNKHENYALIENSKEFKEYLDFHNKYWVHHEVFLKELNFALPVHPKGSNLTNTKFKRLLKKAKQLVIDLDLPPIIDKKTIKQIKSSEHYKQSMLPSRKTALSTARKNIITEKLFTETPVEEFEKIIDTVENDDKLSKLFPVILMMNFSDCKDFDQVDSIYKRFKTSKFSVVKLVNAKAAIEKASDMISKGWLKTS